jgi:predicted PurR-regulated permease PerM
VATNLLTNKWQIVMIILFSQIISSLGIRLQHLFQTNISNKNFECGIYLVHRIKKRISRYIRMEFCHSLVAGLLVYVAFKLLHIMYPLSFGVFAAFAAAIPYFGLFLGMLFPLIELIVRQGITFNLVFVVITFSTIVIVSHVLFDLDSTRPRLTIKTVLMFTILGAITSGIVGALLIVPLFSVVKIVWQSFDEMERTELDFYL